MGIPVFSNKLSLKNCLLQMNETTFFKHGDQMEQVLYRAFGRARIPIALRLTVKHI